MIFSCWASYSVLVAVGQLYSVTTLQRDKIDNYLWARIQKQNPSGRQTVSTRGLFVLSSSLDTVFVPIGKSCHIWLFLINNWRRLFLQSFLINFCQIWLGQNKFDCCRLIILKFGRIIIFLNYVGNFQFFLFQSVLVDCLRIFDFGFFMVSFNQFKTDVMEFGPFLVVCSHFLSFQSFPIMFGLGINQSKMNTVQHTKLRQRH